MILKLGHRGASGHEPENTMVAFERAIELGADGIELDVHLSKDNHLIVVHDPTLDRTTNGKGGVDQKTLAEIKTYKTIDGDQPIPTLQEVLDNFKDRIRINIEIKGTKPAQAVCDLIKKNNLDHGMLIISSSSVKSIQLVNKELPDVVTALIYYSARTTFREIIFVLVSLLFFPITKMIILSKLKKVKVESFHPVYPFATRNFVAKLHKKGYRVSAWPVNKPATIKRMKYIGVDGIISDYPDRL